MQAEGTIQLGAMQAQMRTSNDQARLAADQERDGTRMGIDIAKSKAQAAAQARAQANKPQPQQKDKS